MKKKKGFLFTIVVIFFSLILVGCNSEKKEDMMIKTPASAKELKKENYEDVQKLFNKAGFEDIQLKEEADLKIGLFSKEGDVDSISIDGDTKFEEGDSFDKTAEVVITYHVFPQEDSTSSNSKEENSSHSLARENSTSSSSKKSEPSSTQEIKIEEKADNRIITVENNSEFVNVLTGIDDYKAYKEFAEKYKNCKVEFDGNIAYMSLHGNNKTRYDFLITPGNYDPNGSSGANFQINNKNVTYDLHLTGDNIPDSISEGLNIRIIATVDSYNEDADLVMITPIEIRIR
ncbi:DUF4839 domain-containing protein [Enterococcus plantarum]|uniref:DUF4839 domain-containing protein n=1 Tax=Enterococcus plantarum TaxID=1077675 RepID=UPI001A8CB6CB|nr:DUF4839 domain-containing protein [Enterococcus plantarum]MBO0421448.1 DUF4839 domain-containing protein [Enterococcus plantarum]